jgi:hypothetical protein
MTIELTERQHSRIKQLVTELQAVERKINPLQDLQKSFQMSIQLLMATVIESHGAPDTQNFTLSQDLRSLVATPPEE